MKDQYFRLRKDWTIKGSKRKFLLLNYRKGLCEERFSISENVYRLLQISTGEYTCSKINTLLRFDSFPYINYLLEIGVAELLDSPEILRSSFEPYNGDSFLERILLYITGRCNLKCKHCCMECVQWEDLRFQEIVNLIERAKKLNVVSISISGGEPFIREDVVDIMKVIDQKEIKIEGIFTNGTLCSKNIIDEVTKIQEFPFFISINGPIAEINDEFTETSGSFDKVIETMSYLVEKRVKIFANTSLNMLLAENQKIEELYNLLKKIGVYRWRISAPFLEGRWKKNHKEYGISIEKELDLLLTVLKLWLADEEPFEIELGHVFRFIEGQSRRSIYSSSSYLCDYFRERIVVLPNGNVSACPLLISPTYAIGNIKVNSLEKIWESKQMRYMKSLKLRDIINNKCLFCNQLPKCGIGCRANAVFSGRGYKDIDPEICSIYKSPIYEEFERCLIAAGLIDNLSLMEVKYE